MIIHPSDEEHLFLSPWCEMPAFDAYQKWLGIPPKHQPPNHYRLLAIERFEDDLDTIENAADRQMAHVRTFASGKHADLSQKLLNEISAAKVELLNTEKKAAYDAALRKRQTPPRPVAKPLPVARPMAAVPPPRPAAPPPRASEEIHIKPTRPADRSHSTAAWQKPLLIGGVAAALMVVVGIVYVASTSNGSTAVASSDENGEDDGDAGNGDKINGNVTSHDVGNGQQGNGDEGNGNEGEGNGDIGNEDNGNREQGNQRERIIDLLSPEFRADLIKQNEHFRFEDGALVFSRPPTTNYSWLELLRDPPEEYDITLRAARQIDYDGLVLIQTSNGRQFDLVLDSSVGMFLRTRKESSEKERPILADRKTHELVCKVRKSGISVLCDGDQIIDWQGDFNELFIHPEHALPEHDALWLGVDPPFRFEQLEIKLLGDHHGVTPTPPALPTPGKAIDLLKRINVERDAVHGEWRFVDSALVSPTGGFVRLVLPHIVPDEYDLHVVVEPQSERTFVGIGLVVGDSQVLLGIDTPKGDGRVNSGLHLLDGIDLNQQNNVHEGKLLTTGVASHIECSVREGRISVTCDGKSVLDWKGDFKRLTNDPKWAVPDANKLFVGTFQRVHHFKEIRLKPLGSEPREPSAGQQNVRLPIPSETARQQSIEEIREIYQDDYAAAKSTAEKSDLAKTLLQQAGETEDDPNGRYALLQEARRLATEGGDVETALATVDRLVDEYEVEGLTVRAESIVALSETARLSVQKNQLSERSFALVNGAIAAEHYDTAGQLAKIALSSARSGTKRDVELIKRIVARQKEIDELAQEYAKAKQALAALEDDPDDPEDNLIAGRFLCFLKGDWEQGLPLLAKGSDAELMAQAAKNLAEPADAEMQVAVGDGWWELASGKGLATKHFRLRAAYWYEEAFPELTGTAKSRIGRRLNETFTLYPTRLPWQFLGTSSICVDAFDRTNALQFPRVPLDHPQIPNELVVECKRFEGRFWGTTKVDTVAINGGKWGWFGKAVVWSVADPEALNATIQTISRDLSNKHELLVVVLDDQGKLLLQFVQYAEHKSDIDLSFSPDKKTITVGKREQQLTAPISSLQVVLGLAVRYPGDKADMSFIVVPNQLSQNRGL